MAKKVEDIVRGAGIFQSLITLLVEGVKELGGSVADIYRLVTPDGVETLRQIAQVIVDAGKKAKGIIVKSLADLIALGKYDYVHPDINEENFPIDKSAKEEETRLFHFGRNMSYQEVKDEMAKEGWKPAKIWHLLFFGAKNPELQKQFPIIAPGSVWRGLVPCLYWYDIHRVRVLYLTWLAYDWSGYCRFLAVRK